MYHLQCLSAYHEYSPSPRWLAPLFIQQHFQRKAADNAGVGQEREQGHQRGAYIVEHDADKHVEGYPEEVDDGGAALLWHILAAHLHHAGPEEAHAGLKHTEGQQLDLALKGDS